MATGNSGATEEKAPSSVVSTASGASGGSKLVVILSLVNLIVTMGMLAVLFVSFQRDKKRPSVEDISARSATGEAEGEKSKEKEGGGKEEEGKDVEKKKPSNFGKMITLDQFTINLSTPGSATPKFVRINISLELPNDEAESEINVKMPQVRNVVIDLFNSKRPADLATVDGREYIKEEIKNALNAFLVSGKVKGVFFTSFALAG